MPELELRSSSRRWSFEPICEHECLSAKVVCSVVKLKRSKIKGGCYGSFFV